MVCYRATRHSHDFTTHRKPITKPSQTPEVVEVETHIESLPLRELCDHHCLKCLSYRHLLRSRKQNGVTRLTQDSVVGHLRGRTDSETVEEFPSTPSRESRSERTGVDRDSCISQGKRKEVRVGSVCLG